MTAFEKMKAIKSIIFHKEMSELDRDCKLGRKAHLIAVIRNAQRYSYYLPTYSSMTSKHSTLSPKDLMDLEIFIQELPTEAF